MGQPQNDDEFLVWVHIPQMQVELWQGGSPQKDATWLGGHVILTGQVACGKYDEFSPVTQVKMLQLIIRPRYRPVDETHPPEDSDPTLFPSIPENALGRILLGVFPGSSKYRIHGTHWPESIGTMASGGCIRMQNDMVEQTAYLLMRDIPIESIKDENDNNVPVSKPFSELLKTRRLYTVTFKKHYRVRVTYQLWKEKMDFTGYELSMTIYPDIYGRLQGRPTPEGCPEDSKNEGNAYTYDHFVRDLKKNGLGPALGVGEEEIKQLWETVKKNMVQFSLTAVQKRENGSGRIVKKEGHISLPVDMLVRGGSWDRIEEEKNRQKIIPPVIVPKKPQDLLPPKRPF